MGSQNCAANHAPKNDNRWNTASTSFSRGRRGLQAAPRGSSTFSYYVTFALFLTHAIRYRAIHTPKAIK